MEIITGIINKKYETEIVFFRYSTIHKDVLNQLLEFLTMKSKTNSYFKIKKISVVMDNNIPSKFHADVLISNVDYGYDFLPERYYYFNGHKLEETHSMDKINYNL